MTKLIKGDYVLATKWSDGNAHDPWAVGFYDTYDEKLNRHFVVDSKGQQFRNGFRRIKKISGARGEFLLKNAADIEFSGHSVYYFLRVPMNKAS